MLTLGIDEAGRGPVIGPLVLCGYLIDEKNKNKLSELKVKDSKLLTKSQRKELFSKIKEIALVYKIIKVSAIEIDKSKNLNLLEMQKMQEIINSMKANKVVIDCPQKSTDKFASKIKEGINDKNVEIICENFADKNHIEVSAASIIAKVTRDLEITKLHKVYGNFGSGYTSDERTINFLKDWIKMNKEFPQVVRHKWATIDEMLKEKRQKRLSMFAR